MKIISFTAVFALLFSIISCDVAEPELTGTQALQPRNVSQEYRLIGKHGYLVLLKENGNENDEIFVLFDGQSHDFQQNLAVARVVATDANLEVQLASGYVMRWTVQQDPLADETGYGLTRIQGSGYYPYFYGPQGPLHDPDVNIVKCKCRPNAENYNCDSGGRGATECSVEHGGSMVGTGVNFKCATKCGEGYYACCTNL